MIICPQCKTSNPDGSLLCSNCSSAFIDLNSQHGTVGLGDTDTEEGVPRWGSARPGEEITVQVVDTGEEFQFIASEFQELMIGRHDPHSPTNPAISLADKGVSRQHATIVNRDGALHITDNNSSNGTYLNGQRLVANQPRILRDGDDVRLGNLVVRINFMKRRR